VNVGKRRAKSIVLRAKGTEGKSRKPEGRKLRVKK